MSGARTHHLLVDGALWHDRPPVPGLDLERHGRALYEDLGDAAARVGPRLLPWPADLDLASVPLPTRLGLSQLEVEVSPEALFQHLMRLRQVAMDDGQRFFLRLADTRALAAIAQAWPTDLLAALKGPVLAWRWCDRDGQWVDWAHEVAGRARPPRALRLSEFEALVTAGEADRLAAELEGLGEEGLKPVQDAAQHRLVARTVAWLAERDALPWPWRWSIAWQAVRTDGLALHSADFEQCLAQAWAAGDPALLRAWCPARPPRHEVRT